MSINNSAVSRLGASHISEQFRVAWLRQAERAYKSGDTATLQRMMVAG